MSSQHVSLRPQGSLSLSRITCLAILTCTLALVGSSASAVVIQYDFNDLSAGQLRTQAGGIGSAGSVWDNTEMTNQHDLIAGDLVAPAGTNFGLTQSVGTALSATGTATSSGTGRVNRQFDSALGASPGDSVWFSFLAEYDNSNTRVGIGFNGTSDGSGTPRILSISSGTLRWDPGNSAPDVNSTSIFGNGDTNLFVGRLDIDYDGTSDRFQMWSNPDVTGALGTPDFFQEGVNQVGSSLTSVSVHSYGNTANRGVIDFITMSDGPNGFMDVTGVALLSLAEWNNIGGGAWGTDTNWNPVLVPQDLEVLFGSNATGPATVTLGADRSVTGVTFNNSNSYTLSGNTLSVGNEDIETQLGSHTIASNLELTGGTRTITSTLGANLNITGTTTTASDAAATFVLDGEGGGSIGAIRDNNDTGNPLDGTDNIDVVKRGAGTWTIGTGTATLEDFHGGSTAVEAGTLKVMGTVNNGELRSSTIAVLSGATLDTSDFGTYSLGIGQSLQGGGTVDTNGNTLQMFSDNVINPGDGAGTLTVDGDLTLNAVEGTSPTGGIVFELSSSGAGTNDQIAVLGDLISNAGGGGNDTRITVFPVDGVFDSSYELITFTGSHTGSAADFALNSSFATRFTQTIVADSDSIDLNITGSNANLTWNGTGGSNAWDVDNSTNWTGIADMKFFQLDVVTFDDSASEKNVEVAESVFPAGMTINNSSGNDYTFSGAGDISGATGIDKSGNGRVTISTTNTYTGVTNIIGGVLHADNNAALGNTSSGTVVNGGALDITGSNIAGETVSIQGSGSDGRGALMTDGFDSEGGGNQQISDVVQTGNATIAAYGPVDALFIENDYRWDLEAGGDVSSASWSGNGHDLTKLGRGTVSINTVGEMNVSNIAIDAGTLLMQGSTTSTGATVTIGSGDAIQDDFSGNAALSFFYSSSTGSATGDAHTMDIVLNGGSVNHNAFGFSDALTINGTIQSLDASGDSQIDNNLFVEQSSNTLIIAQPISGAGDLRYSGEGVVQLEANNTYTGRSEVTGNLNLVGTAQLSGTNQIDVTGTLDVTGRNDGSLNLSNQALNVTDGGTLNGNILANGTSTVSVTSNNTINGNVTIGSASKLVGGIDSNGLDAGQVIGNVVISSGGILEVNTGKGTDEVVDAFLQNASTIGAGSFNYVAFEAENFTTYNDNSANGWTVQAALDGSSVLASGGEALVASGGNTATGDDDTAQYDMVFSEPGTYAWYVRTAAPSGTSADSFYGPSQNADTANPSVSPSGGESRFGIGSELKDAEDAGGITTDWDWLRSDPSASSLVSFEQVTVTQADVDNQTVFSLAFETRQAGAQLDKMVLVNTANFTALTDLDLDGVAENATSQIVTVPAPFLSFDIDGDLTLGIGSTLAIDLRASDDFDNLSVLGTAELSGLLSVNLDGFTPSINDTFSILTASTFTDSGITLGGPDGSQFDLSASTGTELILTFTGSLVLPGDFNDDGFVNAADYTVWRDNLGGSFDLNGNGDETGGSIGIVDSADYALWVSNYGNSSLSALQSSSSVPEPSSALLLLFGSVAAYWKGRRR